MLEFIKDELDKFLIFGALAVSVSLYLHSPNQFTEQFASTILGALVMVLTGRKNGTK